MSEIISEIDVSSNGTNTIYQTMQEYKDGTVTVFIQTSLDINNQPVWTLFTSISGNTVNEIGENYLELSPVQPTGTVLKFLYEKKSDAIIKEINYEFIRSLEQIIQKLE